jgi:hypothetical protein
MSTQESTSLCLLEHDLNADTLASWSYPAVPPPLQALVVLAFQQHLQPHLHLQDPSPSHCISPSPSTSPLLYFKHKSDWVYMQASRARKDVCADIVASALCVVSKSFNPEKYGAMLAVLHEQFLASGDPTTILEGYLSIHATGKFKGFDSATFRDEDALLAECCLKDIVR